jgi:hypothetical protein
MYPGQAREGRDWTSGLSDTPAEESPLGADPLSPVVS